MLDRIQLERWLFGTGPGQRRTQDSPILPEVWYAYALPPSEVEEHAAGLKRPLLAPTREDWEEPTQALAPPEDVADLLLRPCADSSSSELAHALSARLERPARATELAYNDVYVACKLTFAELLRSALPLTNFWRTRLWAGRSGSFGDLVKKNARGIEKLLVTGSRRVQGQKALKKTDLPGDVVWLVGLVGRVQWEQESEDHPDAPLPTSGELIEAAIRAFGDVELDAAAGPGPLSTVSRNRTVQTAVARSRIACKADAATRVFGLSCRDIRWAVIDSGIDARHPAFAVRNGDDPVKADAESPAQSANARIEGTWDFATIRQVLAERTSAEVEKEMSLDDAAHDEAKLVEHRVALGRAVDWEAIAPELAVHHDKRYREPKDDHGTHVAGILAGDWRPGDTPSVGDSPIQGICPDLVLYDLRAFDDTGASDEFQVLSAMQFVRHLNAHADVPVVHGVNLSFSVRHDVDKYAAGATPVCEEAHRVVGSGVVVVAAAGNDGRGGYVIQGRAVDGYRSVSITDPGNAEKVITVGATHRDKPHTYGVSYFSSRGPTGDGRAKPDLVAPGEKITSTVPGAGLQSKDGTSQATPHVSGACALLMARHAELIGQPDRIKEVLVETCTDLGRERSFQGAGMIDILRAIQAV